MTRKTAGASAIAVALLWFAAGLHAIDRGERWRPGGERQAAEYIAAQLARAGVTPAFPTGYAQPVPLRSRRILEQYSSLALVRGGQEQRLIPGEDAVIDLSFDPGSGTQSPLVFAGYGFSSPELGYDDLAGLDLRGKIAVVLAGGPPHLPPGVRAHFQSVEERNIVLRRKAGAYGILTIPDPEGWAEAARRRLEPSLSLADPAFEQDDDLELSVVMNPARAEALFTGSGHTFAEVLAAAAGGRPMPRFPLAATLRASVATERQATESRNIVGVLPGSDPELRRQYVVLSGRIGDEGTAALLDTAERLRASGVKLRRSLLFVFLTSEEQGLLGSQFLTRYVPTGAGSLVADLDAGSRERGQTRNEVTVSAASESDLGVPARAAGKRAGFHIREEDRTIPGSYYNFLIHGIPAAGVAMEPVDMNRPGDRSRARRFGAMLLQLTKRVANATERPGWKAQSYFSRFGRSVM